MEAYKVTKRFEKRKVECPIFNGRLWRGKLPGKKSFEHLKLLLGHLKLFYDEIFTESDLQHFKNSKGGIQLVQTEIYNSFSGDIYEGKNEASGYWFADLVQKDLPVYFRAVLVIRDKYAEMEGQIQRIQFNSRFLNYDAVGRGRVALFGIENTHNLMGIVSQTFEKTEESKSKGNVSDPGTEQTSVDAGETSSKEEAETSENNDATEDLKNDHRSSTTKWIAMGVAVCVVLVSVVGAVLGMNTKYKKTCKRTRPVIMGSK